MCIIANRVVPREMTLVPEKGEGFFAFSIFQLLLERL